jgi:enoyl-CoA hydratase/carnithine racemase
MTSTPTEAEPHALIEQRGHTLVVTMNRPERLNALTGEMIAPRIHREARTALPDEVTAAAIAVPARGLKLLDHAQLGSCMV